MVYSIFGKSHTLEEDEEGLFVKRPPKVGPAVSTDGFYVYRKFVGNHHN